MARRKPEGGVAVTTLEEADKALAELAKLNRKLALIDSAMNEDIEAARARANELAGPIRADRDAIEGALKTFTTVGKDTLFSKKKKSMTLVHGILGFRASDELKPLPKFTWGQVLGALKGMGERLQAKGLPTCIRIKEEPDKEALRQLPEDLRAEAGVRIVPKDTFYYEIKTESVAEKAA